MKKLKATAFLLFITFSVFGQDLTDDQKSVKEEVIKTYVKPMYQGGTLETLEQGLHEGFEMFVYYQGEFSKRSKEQWLARLTEVRSKPKPKTNSTPKQKRSVDFDMIDVTGITAVAKLKVFFDDKLKFTDYLTLYKMNGEWKILSKFFTFH